tara:strand:- start:2652 stop:3143 length:492 start_codon:yes stop_codon:yes gene_type:complete
VKEVLDTAALISWPIIRLNGCYAIPSQKIELCKIYPKKEIKIDSAELIWIEPDEKSLEIATNLAISTGDMAGLSKIDLGILALSINLKKTLVTDDYRLQNLAEKAGIEWKTVSTKGIKELWKWELRCIACKKIYSQPGKPNQKKSDWGECEDCGSELKLKRIR